MDKTKRLKATDFLLKIMPEYQNLKIGFGEFFYEKEQEICLTEDFSSLKTLQKVENLEVDENKRIAVFDSFFKGMQTHFIVKEVYSKTLDVMKFVKSYNKTPFPIKSCYKDEASIVIDKDGFDLILRKPNCENAIHLFSMDEKIYFQISFPEPTMRFVMKSCDITLSDFYIEHESYDLIAKREIDRTIFRWNFDIQPELQDLFIYFMRLAIFNYENKPEK